MNLHDKAAKYCIKTPILKRGKSENHCCKIFLFNAARWDFKGSEDWDHTKKSLLRYFLKEIGDDFENLKKLLEFKLNVQIYVKSIVLRVKFKNIKII